MKTVSCGEGSPTVDWGLPRLSVEVTAGNDIHQPEYSWKKTGNRHSLWDWWRTYRAEVMYRGYDEDHDIRMTGQRVGTVKWQNSKTESANLQRLKTECRPGIFSHQSHSKGDKSRPCWWNLLLLCPVWMQCVLQWVNMEIKPICKRGKLELKIIWFYFF